MSAHREFGPDCIPRRGQRCQQIGGKRRHGKILSDLWGGYVAVDWDGGRVESMVHLTEIRPEAK